MAWIFLLVAGLFEIGFTTCLKLSDGFTKVVPSVCFVALAAVSFGLLTVAMKSIPLGTAYAVWTGIGAAGTAVIGFVFFMLAMATWRSRRWLLTGGLGGIALGCYLPIALDLVSVVPYTMSLAFIGLAGACLTFLRIRKRA